MNILGELLASFTGLGIQAGAKNDESSQHRDAIDAITSQAYTMAKSSLSAGKGLETARNFSNQLNDIIIVQRSYNANASLLGTGNELLATLNRLVH